MEVRLNPLELEINQVIYHDYVYNSVKFCSYKKEGNLIFYSHVDNNGNISYDYAEASNFYLKEYDE